MELLWHLGVIGLLVLIAKLLSDVIDVLGVIAGTPTAPSNVRAKEL